jgi:putative intracellular protease/amidase
MTLPVRPAAVLALCLLLPSLTSPQPPVPGARGDGAPIRILMLMGNHVGGYHYYTRDLWEQCGWDLTAAGLAPVLQPCNLGVAFHVDTLITQITDLSAYDCLAIMQARAYDGMSHSDLLASPEAIALVRQAVAESLLVVATCGGVRLLAAADVIAGRTVTGYALYAPEYIAAGATYAGDDVPPILDGTILTSAHGRYYCQQITETMRAYFAARQGRTAARDRERGSEP